MKTTVELSDALVAKAKAVALKRGISLRELVERGLERGLEAAESKDLEKLLSRLDRVGEKGSSLWQDVEADSYVREQRSGWNE